MKDWYLNLNQRERLIVTIGAAVLIVFALYAITWAPLSKSTRKLQRSVQNQESLLQWANDASAQIRQLRTSQPKRMRTTGKSLLSIVDQSATQSGIKANLKRMDPDGENALKLQVSAVSFDRLVHWVGELERNFGISVSSIALTRTEQTGLVEARLTLERAA